MGLTKNLKRRFNALAYKLFLIIISVVPVSCKPLDSCSKDSPGMVPSCASNVNRDQGNQPLPTVSPPSPTVSPASPIVSAASMIIPIGWDYVFDSLNNLYSQAPSMGLLKTSTAGLTTTYFANTDIELIGKDSQNNIYLMVIYSNTASSFSSGGIQKVAPDGSISVVCNSMQCSSIPIAQGIAIGGGVVDSHGNIFVPIVFWAAGNAYAWTQIAKITPSGAYSAFSGVDPQGGNQCSDGSASSATISGPARMVIDSTDTIYISDIGINGIVCNSIRKIAPDGSVSTVHSFGANLGSSLAMDAKGNLYYYIYTNPSSGSVIKMLSPAGVESTYCGGAAYSGSRTTLGSCASAYFAQIVGDIAFDATGDLFFTSNWSGNANSLPYYDFYQITP